MGTTSSQTTIRLCWCCMRARWQQSVHPMYLGIYTPLQHYPRCGEIIQKKWILQKSKKRKSTRENPRFNELEWTKILCAQPTDNPCGSIWRLHHPRSMLAGEGGAYWHCLMMQSKSCLGEHPWKWWSVSYMWAQVEPALDQWEQSWVQWEPLVGWEPLVRWEPLG